MDDLLAVMLEARRLIALPENDFTWSSFIDQEAALEEIDGFIDELEAGTANPSSPSRTRRLNSAATAA